MILAIACILAIGSAAKSYEEQQQTPASCPETAIPKDDVWQAHLAIKENDKASKIYAQAKIHCYCFEELMTKLNVDALTMLFDPKDPDSDLCNQWVQNYYAKKYLKQLESVSVIIINILATLIFEGLGKFQKFYTKNQ